VYQGHPPDDSDDEWDEYISHRYGEVALEHPDPETVEDQVGLDIAAVMLDTFGR
jgi:hypothetical protein